MVFRFTKAAHAALCMDWVQQLNSWRLMETNMRRVHAIEESFAFRGHMRRIEDAEQTREFCKHGMTHLLDVARIAWIFNLERGLGFDREVVYAAALLHDLGRSEQYATGEDHDVAGARIAADILDSLPDGLRFDADERAVILAAVSGHRGACADGEVVVAPRAAEVLRVKLTTGGTWAVRVMRVGRIAAKGRSHSPISSKKPTTVRAPATPAASATPAIGQTSARTFR